MNFLFLRILNGPKEFANLYIYVRKITINYEFTVFTTYFNRKYQKQTKLYKKKANLLKVQHMVVLKNKIKINE